MSDQAGERCDPLLADAIELVVGTQYGSSAMLQRHLEIPRARADALILLLEEHGVLGPLPNVGKARPVLVRAERVQEVLDALEERHGYGDEADCLCGRNFDTVRGLRGHITKARA